MRESIKSFSSQVFNPNTSILLLLLSFMAMSNSDLPDEIISEILLRLPVKPVGRFRCVSKPWRSLLTSPYFLKTHSKLHTDDAGNLIFTSRDGPYILTLAAAGERSTAANDGVARKVQSELEYHVAVGSCDGLLLLEDDQRLSLMNPITLESTRIRDTERSFEGRYHYGFGYDSLSDDYKVFLLWDEIQDDDYDFTEEFAEVYSLKTKCWKRIDKFCKLRGRDDDRDFDPGVFLHGRIHWLSYDEMACFDLAREEFVEPIQFPNIDKQWFDGVFVFDGCLALCDPRLIGLRYRDLKVWVMKDYGVRDSWTEFTIVTNAYQFSIDDCVCDMNGDEFILLNDDHQLVAYNWRNGITRDFVTPGLPRRTCYSRVIPFKPSLLSPNL